MAFSLSLLSACAGQGSAVLEGPGAPGNPVGGPVGGQGQPTIQPGADHQPGIPTGDEPDYKDTFIPAPPPDDPEAPHGTDLLGPKTFKGAE
ncbi:MAG: hypothetical protein U1F66_04755 [bacterium]